MPGFNIQHFENGGDIDVPRGTVEVARAHRWKILINHPSFSNGNNNINIYAKSCDRPSVEMDRMTMHHGINEIYMPGKIKWAPIEIKYYEAEKDYLITPSAALYKWYSQIYSFTKNRFTKSQVQSLKGTVEIKQVAGDSTPIFMYGLSGVWPTKIAASSLDYTLSDVSEVTVTLAYDHAMPANVGN